MQSFAVELESAPVTDKVVFTGVEVFGEYSNFTYYNNFMTEYELTECVEMEALRVARDC